MLFSNGIKVCRLSVYLRTLTSSNYGEISKLSTKLSWNQIENSKIKTNEFIQKFKILKKRDLSSDIATTTLCMTYSVNRLLFHPSLYDVGF